MKRLLFFVLACIGWVGISYAQFVSVKQGDWSDPKTWSTNPESTAIPDSTSDVIVQHYVVVYKYYQSLAQRCKSLTILADGRITSYSHGEQLVVETNLVNYGIIMPSYDFYLKVKGDLVNHGIVKNHYINSKTTLELHGNLINNGSFTKVTDLIFQGNGTAEHVHTIKSMNDSTIYMGDARISDALGKVVVDSVARLSSTSFDLYDGKLIIPASGGQLYANNLYVRYGTLEANHNSIRSDFGALVLGNNYNTRTNTYVSNAIFDCTVSVGGGSLKAHHAVLLGQNTLRGLLIDWYQGSIWTADDRGLRIAGKLINEGEIRNATVGTGNGLWIHMEDGSEFINQNDSLRIEAMVFDGHCKFTNLGDTLDVEKWIGTDTATVLELTHSVWFDKTINIDLKGGKLILPSDGLIKTLYLWYNRMNNTRIEANGGGIQFAALEKNCTFDEVSLRGVYCMEDVLFTGKTTVDTYLFPYEYRSSVLTCKGDFENKGIIRNHPSSGSLMLHLTADVFSTGTEWANYETRINGSKNQHIIITGTSYLTGKVYFDAMITGAAYKWQKNGVDIPDATASSLMFASGINASHFGVYQCIVDGTTNSRTIFVGDEIPPAFEINEVLIKNISPTSALIRWKTSVPASGFIFYAENDNSQGHPLEAMESHELTTSHSVVLENLTTGATIYFVIDQSDADMNDIRSEEFRFVAGDMTLGALKIKKIVDVPDDQGGWVHIHFESDMLDRAGDISMYGIWQWNNNDWVSIGHVPALQKDEYIFLAHTYADSTSAALNWSKFYITAHTVNPLLYYTCEVDSGYSIDNLIPSVPTGLAGVRTTKGTELSWNANPDPDVQYYLIYRNDELIGYSETNSFVDEVFLTGDSGALLRYAIAAVDFSGNKSQRTPDVQVVISSVSGLNAVSVQLINSPNPFVESTLIMFELTENSQIELSVTDLTGKQIRILADREFSPGAHQIEFNAAGLSSGVYFCRLRSADGVKIHKMILR